MGGPATVVIIRCMAEERRLTCAVCHVVIGVYEPVLVVGHESAPPTSLAREPMLRTNGCELVHAACARDA
jgi:hypothetical protein